MTMEIKQGCPLCGSDNPKGLFQARDPDRAQAGPYLLARCTKCSLVFVHPPTSEEEIAAAYGTEFFSGPREIMRKPFELGQRLLLMERIRLLRRWAPVGKLMDVGCGDGAFLSRMKKAGFEVVGVEASDMAASRARTRGINVEVGNLENLSFLDETFDVITLWQVLEHLPNPREILETCRRLLKPDGVLVVSVPNFASLQRLVFCGRWFHLDVPRHRVHFEPNTINRILKNCGFAPRHSTQLSFEYNPYGFFQSSLNLFTKPNHLYRILRRREAPAKAAFATMLSFSIAPFWAPASVLLSSVESLAGYGATITIVAGRDDA